MEPHGNRRMWSGVDVLTVILQRLEKRAEVLEAVRLPGMEGTTSELKNFARMVRNARDYLQRQRGEGVTGK